eukprot:gene10145-biopygen6264
MDRARNVRSTTDRPPWTPLGPPLGHPSGGGRRIQEVGDSLRSKGSSLRSKGCSLRSREPPFAGARADGGRSAEQVRHRLRASNSNLSFWGGGMTTQRA